VNLYRKKRIIGVGKMAEEENEEIVKETFEYRGDGRVVVEVDGKRVLKMRGK